MCIGETVTAVLYVVVSDSEIVEVATHYEIWNTQVGSIERNRVYKLKKLRVWNNYQ